MAVKVAIDLGVFSVLAQATTPVSLAELALKREADPQLVGDYCLLYCL
jgi:Dimerisation domain